MKISRALLAFASVSILAASLTGCASTINLQAAPDANNPGCATVTVRLGNTVGSQSRRLTNAQATAAWGTPANILLRCGIEPVTVSTLKCVTVSGVDWLVDGSKDPSYRFITFGRTPATEVILDSTKVSGATVLDDLSGAINRGKVTAHCN
jgi:hypothetical protein